MMSRIGLMVASTILTGSVFAAPITGRLIMNGTSLVGDTTTTIDFNYAGCGSTTPICTPPPNASNSSTGTFQVGFGSTQSFGGALIGTNGTVRSFDIFMAPPGSDLGAGGAIPNFILIPTLNPISLQEVFKGSFSSAQCGAPAAAGQTCTPVIGGNTSPLELSNSTGTPGQGDGTGLNSHAQFSVLVRSLDTATGIVSVGTGTFSTDFAGYSYQTLLNAALAGKVITTGYHGDFTINFTTVPEPSSMTLGVAGAALIGLSGLVGRLRQSRKSV